LNISLVTPHYTLSVLSWSLLVFFFLFFLFLCFSLFIFFFFNDTATTEIYTLSLTTLFRSPRKRLRSAPTIGNKGGLVTTTMISRSEEHTSELQSRGHLVCRLLLEKKKKNHIEIIMDEMVKVERTEHVKHNNLSVFVMTVET